MYSDDEESYSSDKMSEQELTYEEQKELFHKRLIENRDLLVHSLRQTPDYLHWSKLCISQEQKKALAQLSRKILNSLILEITVVEKKPESVLLYSFKINETTEKKLPVIEECEADLARVYRLAQPLKKSIPAFNALLSEAKVEAWADFDANVKKLMELDAFIDEEEPWADVVSSLNASSKAFCDTMFDYQVTLIEEEKDELLPTLNNLAQEMKTFLIHKIQAFARKTSLQHLRHWAVLIHELGIDNEVINSDEILVDTVNVFLKKEEHAALLALNNDFLKYCRLKSRVDNAFPSLFSQPILKILKDAKNVTNSDYLCKLGHALMTGQECSVDYLLACNFYETAFIYSKNKPSGEFAFTQLKSAYTKLFHKNENEYDERNIFLNKYLEKIKAIYQANGSLQLSNRFTNITICLIAKIQIDYIKGAVSNSLNIHLMNLRDHLSHPSLKLSKEHLQALLFSVHSLYTKKQLGVLDRVCFEEIMLEHQLYDFEPEVSSGFSCK